MSLPGKVTAVFETTATVEVVPRSECQGCHACSGLSDGGNQIKTRSIKAIKGDIEVKPGDEVLLDLNPGEGSLAALLVFGFPMAAFFAGLFLTPFIAKLTGSPQNDLLMIITGFSFMGAAFVVLALFARSRHAEKLTMKIIRKIDAADLKNLAGCQLKK